jgi:hypothetical protein
MSRVKSYGRVPKAKRAALRRQLESFDRIDVASDEMREIVEASFPDLLANLPPRKPPAPSTPRRRSRTRTGSGG